MIAKLFGPLDFFGRPRKIIALHCYLLQAGAFSLALYLFLSWDFSGLALLPGDVFHGESRGLLNSYWKTPWMYWTSLQFIYEYIPRPSASILNLLQIGTIVSLLSGLIGFFPRISASIAFLLGMHLVGWFLFGGSAMDASTTMMLFMLLVVALFPPGACYELGKRPQPMVSSVDFHGPIFVLLLFVSAYYFYCGLNKIIDFGPNWPIAAGLDVFSLNAIEKSLFVSNWATNLWFSNLLCNHAFATFSAFLVFIFELGAPLCLFFPRMSPFILMFFASMHFGIYLSHGYGYWTNIGADLMLLPVTAITAWLQNRLKSRASDCYAPKSLPLARLAGDK